MSIFEPGPPEAVVPRSQPSAERITLQVQAAAFYTEIRVLDARFEPVPLGANTGAVTIDVTPGLYEVGFRFGSEWQSQHVIAEPGRQRIVVTQEPPLKRDRDPDSVRDRALGDGLPLGDATVVVTLWATGSGIAVVEGLCVALIQADGAQTLAPDLTPESETVWCFKAPSGLWRLRINEPTARQPFEMTVTVLPNYIAHISAPLIASNDGLCVDLERLRFRYLSQADIHTADPELLGFEDAALAALGSARSLFGPGMDRLIEALAGDKAANPMLGIFAAHLCERGGDDQMTFREKLLGRLEQLTGGPWSHPDVGILRLSFTARHGGLAGSEPPVFFPPTLAASWRMLLEVAREHPRLIPAGSFCERIADRLWASSLWTAWTAPPLSQLDVASPPLFEQTFTPATRSAVENPPDNGPISNKIAELLGHRELREWFRIANERRMDETEGLAWESESLLTQAEAAVASVLFPVASSEDQQRLFSGLAEKLLAQSGSVEKPDPTSMAGSLGLPQSTVERALSSLGKKLDTQAESLNINV